MKKDDREVTNTSSTTTTAETTTTSDNQAVISITDLLKKYELLRDLASGRRKKVEGKRGKEMIGGWREIEDHYSFDADGRLLNEPMNLADRTVGTIQEEFQKNAFTLAKSLYIAFEKIEQPWDETTQTGLDNILASHTFIGSAEPRQRGASVIPQRFIQNLRDFIQAYKDFKNAYKRLSEDPELFNQSFHVFLQSQARGLAKNSSLGIKSMGKIVEIALASDKLKQDIVLNIDDVFVMRKAFSYIYSAFAGLVVGPFSSVIRLNLLSHLLQYLSKELIVNFQFYFIQARHEVATYRLQRVAGYRLQRVAGYSNEKAIKKYLLDYADPTQKDKDGKTPRVLASKCKADSSILTILECAEHIHHGMRAFNQLIGTVHSLETVFSKSAADVDARHPLLKPVRDHWKKAERSFEKACALDLDFVAEYIDIMLNNAISQETVNHGTQHEHRYLLALITVASNSSKTQDKPALTKRIRASFEGLVAVDVDAKTVSKLFNNPDAKRGFLVRHKVLANGFKAMPCGAGQATPTSLWTLAFVQTIKAEQKDPHHLLSLAMSFLHTEKPQTEALGSSAYHASYRGLPT